MKNKFTKEAKIGIVTIVSLILLYVGVNYLKGINLFKPVNHYFVQFDNVKDVTISSPVYVEGFKVGLVRSISYDYEKTNKILVEISLDKEMRINKGSYVNIVKTLLSGAELHIQLNTFISEYLPSGSSIEGRQGADMLQGLQDNLLPGVEALLPKIDSILVGLNSLISSPALSQSLANIEKTTSNLEYSSRQLSHLLSRDIPPILDDLKVMSTNFAELSLTVNDLDIKSTMQSLNHTVKNLELTTDKLNSSDNSLGLLLNDKGLYQNLNGTMENASLLLFDLKENPKRYVHFSLF
ncbi:MlaD family protein [Parabacteroides sp. OttesenSCG-928-N08]|nr:MlaD family protein [Parabacteroides sp. OttesenSCG-928-N08]